MIWQKIRMERKESIAIKVFEKNIHIYLIIIILSLHGVRRNERRMQIKLTI